ncbi:hypothetical protein D1872_225000 [compost metagenome]
MRDVSVSGLRLFEILAPLHQAAVRTDLRLRHSFQRCAELPGPFMIRAEQPRRLDAVLEDLANQSDIHGGACGYAAGFPVPG